MLGFRLLSVVLISVYFKVMKSEGDKTNDCCHLGYSMTHNTTVCYSKN